MTERPSHVLITFYSVGSVHEKLALACAVGAVQAHGLIRLRRLSDGGASADSVEEGKVLERMRREYVGPTQDDVEWADALVMCGQRQPGGAWDPFLDILAELGRAGRLDGKVGLVVGADNTPAGGTARPPSQPGVSGWSARPFEYGLMEMQTDREAKPDSGSGDAVPEARTAGQQIVAVARALAQDATS